jgi:hypothetical protein
MPTTWHDLRSATLRDRERGLDRSGYNRGVQLK